MEKKELRAQVRQKKSAYTPAQLVEISVSIIEKLKANSKFHAAHTICLYRYQLPVAIHHSDFFNIEKGVHCLMKWTHIL